MFAPWLALCLSAPGQPEDVLVLDRYVQDTTLDRGKPDTDYGRDTVIRGGPGVVALVRFPQLVSGLPPGKRVKSARLVLTPASQDVPVLDSVGRMTTGWEEGSADGTATGKEKKSATGDFAATWNSTGFGRRRWAAAGATDDSQPVQATGATQGDQYVVTGLGTAVQAMLDHPASSFGLGLAFKGNCAFLSGDFFENRPRLEIQLEDGPTAGPDLAVLTVEPRGGGWVARLGNLGSAPAPAGTLEWSDGSNSGKAERPEVAPGAEVSVPLGAAPQSNPTDPRSARLVVSASCPGDVQPVNNEASVWTDGTPVQVTGGLKEQAAYQVAAGALNSWVFPMSRYVFAREGCLTRLRLVTAGGDGAPTVKADTRGPVTDLVSALVGLPKGFWSKWPVEVNGVGVLGDTRDDTRWLNLLPLPPIGYQEAVGNPVSLQQSGLVSSPEVYLLNSLRGKSASDRLALMQEVPNVLLLRFQDLTGQPLANCAVDYVPTSKGELDEAGALHMKTDALGNLRVGGRGASKNSFGPVDADGGNAWVQIRTKRGATVVSLWMPVWQLWQEVARGNKSVGTLECRVNQSTGEIDTRQDLAANKIVTDSFNDLPAQLVALVDSNPTTSFDLDTTSKPGWIEIDLGRDRPVGEVRISFAKGSRIWNAFDIAGYGTAQTPSSAKAWFHESMGAEHVDLIGNTGINGTTMVYRAPAVTSRYLRIIPRESSKVSLTGIEVYPAIVQ